MNSFDKITAPWPRLRNYPNVALGTKPAKVEGVGDEMCLLYQVLTRLASTLA
jgi:hypothetical protein